MLARIMTVLLLVCFLGSGCGFLKGKPLPEDKKDYVGQWQGVGMTLTITADGGLDYKRVGGEGSRELTGPIDGFEGNDIIVKALFLSTRFKVDKPPFKEGPQWKMIVDGIELFRPDPTYVAPKETPPPTMASTPLAKTTPDLANLERLINQSMKDFAQSVVKGDFTDFHRTISRLWQNQITPDELNKAFGVFIEKKVDIISTVSQKPVMGKEPVIDQDGILILEGYFPDKEWVVHYNLSFIYEHPEWKLFGIDVKI